MEDISKELEREIERSRPKPYRKERKAALLIVDDFGNIKSGDYLKTLVKWLSVLCLICFVSAVVLGFLYSDLLKESNSTGAKLAAAVENVGKLIKEKEILMAKLVIAGDELDSFSKTPESNEKKKKHEVDPVVSEPEFREESGKTVESEQKEDEKNQPAADLEKPAKIVNKTVTIENFTVKKSRSTNELFVRFDIRKTLNKPGEVSGRIFTILKPENTSQDQWLVIPSARLKQGIPFEYAKGQYFSIVNFKPVRFRIKNQVNPEQFQKASIFVFNEQNDLIFQKLITITDDQ